MVTLELVGNFVRIIGANDIDSSINYIVKSRGRFDNNGGIYGLFTSDFEGRYHIGKYTSISQITRDNVGNPIITPFASEEELVSFLTENIGVIGNITSNNTPQPVTLARNDLGYDAWGRPKMITDFTIFAGMWSLSVPNRLWLQYNDIGAGFTEQSQIDKTFIKSTGGNLSVKGSLGIDRRISSKRHPRYQPNKGLLYSTAVILPNPNQIGKRSFGLKTNGANGVYFELVGNGASWIMNIVRMTTVLNVTTFQTENITSLLPVNFDPSKGHVYDIQMEWRGVGDFYIYVDLSLIYIFALLGTLTGMSVSNPALQVTYDVIGADSDSEIIIGCVDVTSEGGHRANKIYTSANTGTVLLPTTNVGKAMLAIKMPSTILYEGFQVPYTRDMLLTELTTFCKDEAFRSVFVARLIATPNLDALASWVISDDSFFEIHDNTSGVLDTAFQLDKANMSNIYSTRNEKDFSISHRNPDPDHSDFFLTAGDIIVVELKSDGTSIGGVALEFAEEV